MRALAIIFPFLPYASAMAKAGILTLEERRDMACAKFVSKITCGNPLHPLIHSQITEERRIFLYHHATTTYNDSSKRPSNFSAECAGKPTSFSTLTQHRAPKKPTASNLPRTHPPLKSLKIYSLFKEIFLYHHATTTYNDSSKRPSNFSAECAGKPTSFSTLTQHRAPKKPTASNLPRTHPPLKSLKISKMTY